MTTDDVAAMIEAGKLLDVSIEEYPAVRDALCELVSRYANDGLPGYANFALQELHRLDSRYWAHTE